MRLTDDDLHAIDIALASRTPGTRWVHGSGGGGCVYVPIDDPEISTKFLGYVRDIKNRGERTEVDWYGGDLVAESIFHKPDRDLIANAPTWLRALLDEVRAHRAKETP
jgi:hypothetical protein